MKKSLVVVVGIAAVVLLAVSQRTLIVSKLFEKGMEVRLGGSALAELDDGLHIALCGAGGPLPAPKASGPCVAVVAGEQLFLVDTGTDGIRNLARMAYSAGDIDGVFLTHFHSDHLDGLGEVATMRWAAGDHDAPLPVFGPDGVEQIVDGFNQAYAQDVVYRHEHHGDMVAPLVSAGMTAQPFATPELGELTSVIDDGNLQVEALLVDHSPVAPAVGYRFTYKGRSILITGDTIKTANIQRFAQGVDILVHEALAPNLVNVMHDAATKNGNAILSKVTSDILDYHASPMDAAETARDAEVGHLLYYHIVPPLVLPGQDRLWLNGAQDVFENYTIGEDGVAFSLPANGTEIIQTRDGL